MELLTDKLLQFALESGIIDIDTVQEQYTMNERKKYIEMHPYTIWMGSDGKWHTYLPDKEKKRVPKRRNTKEEIEQAVIEFWKGEEFNPTVAEVFVEWNDRRLDLQQISSSTHLRNKQIFNRFFSEFGKKRIGQIRQEEIADFLEEQIPKHNLTAKAFAGLKGVTKGIIKRARKRKLISFSVEDVFCDLDIPDRCFRKEIKEDYEEVFDEEETHKMISYVMSHQDPKNLGILLMFVTGIRVGELVAIRNDSLENGCIFIRRTEIKFFDYEKNANVYEVKEFPKSAAGIREVVIPKDYSWLYSKLTELNPEGEYVFLADDGTRMTTNCIRNRLRRLCHKLDIHEKSPHKIRKTYGSILLDNNLDRRLIMDQMGHADISCTEMHYHRNRRSLEQKTQVISQIPEFRVK